MLNAMTVCAFGTPEVIMRHDPASGAIINQLRSLKMHAMAQTVTEPIDNGPQAIETAIHILP